MAKAHLNMEKRIELEAALRPSDSQASVAARLDRSAGTISREVALNGGLGCYRAAVAHRAAQGRRGAARRGDYAIDEHPPLRAEVHERLHRGWSPEEIAGSLKRDHPDLSLMHTSHESIYRYVYVVARGELQRELAACLRRHHRTRKPRRRGVAATQGKLQDMVLVDQRPPEVEDRLIPGHYEGDLILGAGNKSAGGVLIERTSRYTVLCHLPEKDATSVREAFTRKLESLPAPCSSPSRTTKAKKWSSTSCWRPTSLCRSSFVTRTVRGSGAPAKARMVASDTTCPKAPTCRWFRISSSAPITKCSTSVPAKSSAGSPRLNVLVNS